MNLYDLTGKESGAVMYPNGDVVITNWAYVSGLPRFLPFPSLAIGLDEELGVRRCRTPELSKRAMRAHEREAGCHPSRTGWRSWELSRDGKVIAIVTINRGWI